MQALALVSFKGCLLCEELPALGTGVLVDGGIGGLRACFVAVRGIAAGQGQCLMDFWCWIRDGISVVLEMQY
jgi:hypothetical protein